MTSKAQGGRPTKLDDALKTKAKKYLNGDYITAGHKVPSIAGLSRYLDVARNSLTNFGEQDAEFLSTLESIKAEQELLLISGGLGGDFNSTIAKLMLTNHGYSDKAQVDNTSSDGSMSPNLKIEFINASNTGVGQV